MDSHHRIVTGLTALCLGFAGCRSARVEAPEATDPQPAYLCQHTTGPITVDGRLDEPDWQRAEVVDKFYLFSPKSRSEAVPTRARLLWDEDTLYVAFQCEDDDIWSYSSEPDDNLWNGDVIELFIKPDADRNHYTEFVIAPNGTLFDALHASRGGGGAERYKAWSSSAQVGSTLQGTDNQWRDDDTSYTIEIAIPLNSIDGRTAPMTDRVWTFGVFRYDYSKSHDLPVLQMSIRESLVRGFHYYEGYRELRFAK